MWFSQSFSAMWLFKSYEYIKPLVAEITYLFNWWRHSTHTYRYRTVFSAFWICSFDWSHFSPCVFWQHQWYLFIGKPIHWTVAFCTLWKIDAFLDFYGSMGRHMHGVVNSWSIINGSQCCLAELQSIFASTCTLFWSSWMLRANKLLNMSVWRGYLVCFHLIHISLCDVAVYFEEISVVTVLYCCVDRYVVVFFFF